MLFLEAVAEHEIEEGEFDQLIDCGVYLQVILLEY
jgi:hypothetical protein